MHSPGPGSEGLCGVFVVRASFLFLVVVVVSLPAAGRVSEVCWNNLTSHEPWRACDPSELPELLRLRLLEQCLNWVEVHGDHSDLAEQQAALELWPRCHQRMREALEDQLYMRRRSLGEPLARDLNSSPE